MSKKINSEKGGSYISVLIGLIVIQIISLSVVGIIYQNNKANQLTSQNVIASELINSYLNLAENKIENKPSNITKEELHLIFLDLKAETTSFNEKNKRFEIDIFLECQTLCEGMNPTTHSTDRYSLNDKSILIGVQVKSKKDFEMVDYRLAVLNQ